MKENLKELLSFVKDSEGDIFAYDEEKLITESNLDKSISIAMLGLTVFGSLLSSLAFFGFIFLFEFNEYYISLLVLGVILLSAAISISRINDELVFESFIVSAFISGLILISYSLFGLNLNYNLVYLFILLLSVLSLIISSSFMVNLIAVLSFHLTFNVVILHNFSEQLQEIQFVYNSLLGLFITYWTLNESFIIRFHNRFNSVYDPIKLGSMAIFLGLFFVTLTFDFYDRERNQVFLIISSIVNIGCILFFVYFRLCPILSLGNSERVLASFVVLISLLPTVFYPAIAGSFLIILLSFYLNYKSGFAAGIVSLLFFISKYYYDLNFSLLEKSGILLVSGIFCLGIYFIIMRRFFQGKTNES